MSDGLYDDIAKAWARHAHVKRTGLTPAQLVSHEDRLKQTLAPFLARLGKKVVPQLAARVRRARRLALQKERRDDGHGPA